MDQPQPQSPRVTFGTVLIAITCTLMTGIGALTVYLLWTQLTNYQRLIDVSVGMGAHVNLGVALGYARAMDSAVVKTSCVFLSFMLFALGALYTFRANESAYRLSAEGVVIKGSLETASPGLVMLTLGVVIIAMAIWREHTITLEGGSVSPVAPADASREVSKIQTSMGTAEPETTEFRAMQIQSLSKVMTILDVQRGALRADQGKEWDDVRPQIDSLRSDLIVRQFPKLRGKWDEWKRQAVTNPDFIRSLARDEAKQLQKALELVHE